MAVLVCLAKHAPEPVPKEKLLHEVWPDTFVSEGVLTRSISELRRVLQDEAKEPRVIQTLPKRGYRIVAQVVPVKDGAEAALAVPDSHIAASAQSSALVSWRKFQSPALLLATAGLFVAVFLGNFGGVRRRVLGNTNPPIHSLAVLPLQNLSGDPGQEYFADAMTEELITELSRVSALKVISRTSVMQFKDSKKPLPQIAHELHVDAIVEGSIVRSGDRVRVTAQLIRAANDTNLWAQTYDRDLKDVLVVQSTVAQAIAQEVRAQVKPQEAAHFQAVRTINHKALEAYLEGRDHLDRAPEFRAGKEQEFLQETDKALASFQRAIQEDPNYLPAYLAIYEAANIGGVVPRMDFVTVAREALRKALDQDDSLVEAHLDMARLFMQLDYDYAAAGQEYQRALELAPQSAEVHAANAEYLYYIGRLEESERESKLLTELDPKYNSKVSEVFRKDRTLEEKRKSLDEVGGDGYDRGVLGLGFEREGRYKDAVEQFIKTTDMLGYKKEAEALRRSYARGDYKGAIRAWMKVWDARSKRQYVPSFIPAFLYASLGDKEDAFRWLEKAYQEHSWCMLELNAEKIWDPIRSDPRFVEYVRTTGLPEDRGQYEKVRTTQSRLTTAVD